MSIVTPYEDLLRFVLETGTPKSDRTGTGTRSLFGQQMRYDLSAGFPLLTTKKVHFKSVAYELLWFLRGDSNIGWLHEHGVTIWDEWASDTGELGPIYGVQWRSWPAPSGEHIDQISAALDLLRTDPDSRRIIVSAWNVGEIERMALPPCHAFFQFYVADGRLSCQLYQRNRLLDDYGIQVEAVDADQARVAAQAYRDYGRGSGHPARLNLGDTYSYALAQVTGEPLLFRGDDFTHTDIRPACT